MSPKRGAGAAVGVGLLRDGGDSLTSKGFLVPWFLGLKVSWFFGLLVVWFFRGVCVSFLGFNDSQFQLSEVSKLQSFKDAKFQ